MDLEALRALIDRDSQDMRVPLLVAAANGLHGNGQIDNLAELADLAAAAGLWLHADGFDFA